MLNPQVSPQSASSSINMGSRLARVAAAGSLPPVAQTVAANQAPTPNTNTYFNPKLNVAQALALAGKNNSGPVGPFTGFDLITALINLPFQLFDDAVKWFSAAGLRHTARHIPYTTEPFKL